MNYLPKFGNNSVGFIYFDNSANNSTGLSESFDYIEFNSDSPKGNFSPSGSSSPQQYRNRNNYFRGKCNNKRYNRYHNSNNYRHPRDSYNSSYNSSFNNSPKHDKRRDNDMSAYYHPSMIEDPWAELEREMDPDSQDNSERSDVELNINNVEDETTDSQDDSQVSAEESS